MQAWILDFLSEEGFQPHGLCLLWRPDVFWAHIISDVVIAGAYFSIPVALMWLAAKRKDLMHRWVLVLFSAFIVACGITHVLAIWTMWVPSYGIEALAKVATATISLATAVMLWPLMPTLLAMPSGQQLAERNRLLAEEVAERKAAELQLKELNENLEQRVAARTALLVRANRELREARDAAERSNQAKSDFLATMSHEIRTPMNGVLGTLDLLRRADGGADEHDRLLEVARDSADSLLALVDDILDHSKLEAGAVELSEAPFSPASVLDQVATLLRDSAEQKGLTLDVGLSANLPDMVVGDAARLRQILFNLAGNAIKFTDGGSVRLGVTRRTGAQGAVELLFSVSDTGIGIAKEAQQRIFNRYEQADASTSARFGGTGLGLAICRQLTDLMGGMIGLDSTEGSGSVFWFTVPCKSDCARGGSIGPSDARRPTRPLDILVAEDNAVNQMVIESFLRAEGHAVTTVGNGLEAIAKCATRHFDVVLMDIYMPHLNGVEATLRLKGMAGPESTIPVIALTASVAREDREAFRRAGMSGFVAKPIDQTALSDALAKAVEERNPSPSTDLRASDRSAPRSARAR